MNRRVVSLAAAMAGGVIVSVALVPRESWSQLGYIAGVRLQSATPGTSDTGHANISGKMIAGMFQGDGSLLTNLSAGALPPNVALRDAPNAFTMSNSFFDVFFADDESGITFRAADATNSPMMQMFSGGTANGDRMVLAHSASFPTWGMQYRDVGDKFVFLGAGSPAMTVELGSFDVGIGLDDPEFTLDVNGRARLREGGGSAGHWLYQTGADHAFIGLVSDTIVGLYGNDGAGWSFQMDTSTGNVGIGSAPQPQKLYVAGGVANAIQAVAGGVNGLRAESTNTSADAVYARATAGTGPAWGVRGESSSTSGIGVRGAALATTGTNYGGFFTCASPSGWALFVDGPTGRDLKVSGTAEVGVLNIVGGADLSELFEVVDDPKPGMVVAIDPDNPGKLRTAKGAYSKAVAGIVSGANGLEAGVVMRDPSSKGTSVPVAMNGRVWVYCDASERAIGPGDSLTSSDTAGYAMAVADHGRALGATIGKAMTRLPKGKKGLVLTLVNLR